MSRFSKIKKKVGKTSDGSVPTNQDLYKRVKAEAKRKFDRYPSAYASSLDCKRIQEKRRKILMSLKRWHKEKWTLPDGSECGSNKDKKESGKV